MAKQNASGDASATEPYSQPTWDKQDEPAFAVLALAGDAELHPGAQLVFVGLFAGRTRQHDMAPAARARLAELGWTAAQVREARFVSFRPGHARTTPGLPDANGAAEAAPSAVEATEPPAAAAAPASGAEPHSGRKRRRAA